MLSAPAAVGVFMLAAAVLTLSASLQSIDTSSLNAMAQMLNSLTKINPEVVVSFKAVTEDMEKITKSIKNVSGQSSIRTMQSIEKMVVATGKSGSGSSGGGKQEITINLDIGGSTLKKFVVDVINNEAKVRVPS